MTSHPGLFFFLFFNGDSISFIETRILRSLLSICPLYSVHDAVEAFCKLRMRWVGGESISENISNCNSVFKNLHNYINNNQRKEYMIEEDK
jgi:predicted DNA repair protein MutK